MWPNRVADGNTRTSTPGILSDVKELELDEHNGATNGGLGPPTTTSDEQNYNNTTATSVDEFPILDELDRLAKVSK